MKGKRSGRVVPGFTQFSLMLVHGQKRKGGEKGWLGVSSQHFFCPSKQTCLSLKLGRKESQESKQASVLSG
jgi:hypothetical protein